jgi:AraC-like DNA-binding protein
MSGCAPTYTCGSRAARPRLSHLAVGAGFFDQAHFTREFKQFSGATPRQFFAENNIFVSRAPASRM